MNMHPERWRFNTFNPVLMWVDSDTVMCTQNLRYHSRSGDLLVIPKLIFDSSGLEMGFYSDIGSKPLWTNALVGDRMDEGTNAYLHHDGLFVFKSVIRNGVVTAVDFGYTQRLLDEMLEVCSMDRRKRAAIVTAVGAAGEKRYNSRVPLDISSINPYTKYEDYGVLTVSVTPSF